jgi:hypothetical protein
MPASIGPALTFPWTRGYCQEEVVELFRLIDWLLKLPEELEVEFQAERWPSGYWVSPLVTRRKTSSSPSSSSSRPINRTPPRTRVSATQPGSVS